MRFGGRSETYPNKGREGLHSLLLIVAVDLNDLKEVDLLQRLLGEGSEDGEEGLGWLKKKEEES